MILYSRFHSTTQPPIVNKNVLENYIYLFKELSIVFNLQKGYLSIELELFLSSLL